MLSFGTSNSSHSATWELLSYSKKLIRFGTTIARCIILVMSSGLFYLPLAL